MVVRKKTRSAAKKRTTTGNSRVYRVVVSAVAKSKLLTKADAQLVMKDAKKRAPHATVKIVKAK